MNKLPEFIKSTKKNFSDSISEIIASDNRGSALIKDICQKCNGVYNSRKKSCTFNNNDDFEKAIIMMRESPSLNKLEFIFVSNYHGTGYMVKPSEYIIDHKDNFSSNLFDIADKYGVTCTLLGNDHFTIEFDNILAEVKKYPSEYSVIFYKDKKEIDERDYSVKTTDKIFKAVLNDIKEINKNKNFSDSDYVVTAVNPKTGRVIKLSKLFKNKSDAMDAMYKFKNGNGEKYTYYMVETYADYKIDKEVINKKRNFSNMDLESLGFMPYSDMDPDDDTYELFYPTEDASILLVNKPLSGIPRYNIEISHNDSNKSLLCNIDDIKHIKKLMNMKFRNMWDYCRNNIKGCKISSWDPKRKVHVIEFTKNFSKIDKLLNKHR